MFYIHVHKMKDTLFKREEVALDFCKIQFDIAPDKDW